MTFQFRTKTSEYPEQADCPRCGATMLRQEWSTGPETVVCSEDENHNGEICRRVGHPEGWARDERCSLCWAPVQWVRVEVNEGRAYTYMAFEDPALEQGEEVYLPANVVKSGRFKGRVIREIPTEKILSDHYQGPFKAVMGRVTPRLSAADEDLL